MAKMPRKKKVPASRLPLLPLRDMVIFPRMVVPLMVGRAASLAAVEESLSSGRPLFLSTQRDSSVEDPAEADLNPIGVAANILQTLRMPDGTAKIVVEGLARGRIIHYQDVPEGAPEVLVKRVDSAPVSEQLGQALIRAAVTQFEQYTRLSQRVSHEVLQALLNVTEPEPLSDLICAHLPLRVEERQELLDTVDVQERLEKVTAILLRENDLLEIERKVRDRVRDQFEKGQRDYYLHEQIKALHQELGERDDGGDSEDLRTAIEKAKMPSEAKEKALREMGRYERMPAMSPESGVIRTYIEWLVDVPWRKRTRDALDLKIAAKVLDEDHYGLEKVKERILEFLAVRKLSKQTKGPILCLVGPPGVGKTSLGKSVARAMGRKFVRVSLGGVRDEAENRGHRRKYIDALPGRIIQSLKKVGVMNPVFMLDEVDKMNADFRGDPASALLEVLDPEQNQAFSDHYLEVDCDLHEVFFITTANNEFDIPYALHDRMEIVDVTGYTTFEKMHIAKLFLVPKQLDASGLKKTQIQFADDAIDRLIQRYTREAGVRELERRIAGVCRKIARKLLEGTVETPVTVTAEMAGELLGPPEFSELRIEALPHIGVAVGMAWTMAGGDILSIETSTMKGKGELTLTGQLGDVMKESAQAAYTYLRAHADALAIPGQFHKVKDIHVHVPEGAIPKDGPSAGLPMIVSILSALRGIAPRAAMSMTGEITLRGRVLPIGGVKEKVLAAHRAGIRTVVMPEENRKNLVDIPEEVRNDIEILFVKTVDEAILIAFPKKPGRKSRAK
ncbi:MAG: ATP-dependent Lon protease [Candidatus Hydrogenedentes bacterium]|nr:ATP-dependent Lon protease [Candidatus Hydrogenedentota bacterium]